MDSLNSFHLRIPKENLLSASKQDRMGRGQGLIEKLDSSIGKPDSPDDLEDASTILINRTIYKERPRPRVLFTISPSISSPSVALYQSLSKPF